MTMTHQKEKKSLVLVPHHDTNHYIAEIDNVNPHGGDSDRHDIEIRV